MTLRYLIAIAGIIVNVNLYAQNFDTYFSNYLIISDKSENVGKEIFSKIEFETNYLKIDMQGTDKNVLISEIKYTGITDGMVFFQGKLGEVEVLIFFTPKEDGKKYLVVQELLSSLTMQYELIDFD